MSTRNIGNRLRLIRLENKLPLRKVAQLIDVDVAILSKMERGERRLTKEHVEKLAKIYKHDKEELMVLYLSEKVVYELGEESTGLKALKVAEDQMIYNKIKMPNTVTIIKILKDFFLADKRVSKAWIFGSYSRNEATPNSDIDVMIEWNNKKKYSMFDFLDVQYKLEQLCKRKIDMVEKGFLKPFAQQTANPDLKQIL